MTAGTSPQRGSPSKQWADTSAILVRAAWLRPARRLDRRIGRGWFARGAAALHFLALVIIITIAWQDRVAAGAATGGLPALHLLFLIATGAAAALLMLHPGEWAAPAAAQDWAAAAEASPQLLAQMSHELRTPLNAVIGFSEVMLRELHGPLGHARYQEYAACISESGGRLLKASEETIAIAATMSALMADRRTLRRERVSAAALLQEAWTAATAAEPGREVRFTAANCAGYEIECDGRATGRALEHLLREAIARSQPDGAVEAGARRLGDARSLEIRVWPAKPERGNPVADPSPSQPNSMSSARAASGGSLRVILARSLLEMQGATLKPCADQADAWSACIAFPTIRCTHDI